MPTGTQRIIIDISIKCYLNYLISIGYYYLLKY